MQKVRAIIKQFDMFPASPTLRAHQEPEITNVCGGVLSILLLGGFAYMLINMNVNIVNWEDIDANQRMTTQISGLKQVNISVFAIQVVDFDAADLSPFLRPVARRITYNARHPTQQTVYEIQICSDQHWQGLGDNLEQYMKVHNVSTMFCLKKGTQISLKNQLTIAVYDSLLISLELCNIDNGSKHTNCATDQEIQQSNQLYISTYLYYQCNFYFLNSVFDPTAQIPVEKIMSSVRTTFTLTRGSQSIVELNNYRIETDTSVLPNENIQTEQGWMLGKTNVASYDSVNNFPVTTVSLYISSDTKVIQRVVGKVDEALSYVGGLFGIILAFLAFFMASFNEYRYQLMVGEGAFNYSDDGHKFKETDFHFIYYLKYAAYDWINTLFCCELNWKVCKQIEETREQANKQLNVSLLFKKIQYFERVIEYLLTEQQRVALHLTEPPSIKQVYRERKIFQYYDKIIKGKSAMTIEDIEVVKQMNLDILGFASEKVRSSKRKSQSRSGFPAEIEQSRENILNFALENFKEEAAITSIEEEDEEANQIEKQIATAVFGMPKKIRLRIQEKIPIKIMNRLRQVYNIKNSEQGIFITLDI